MKSPIDNNPFLIFAPIATDLGMTLETRWIVRSGASNIKCLLYSPLNLQKRKQRRKSLVQPFAIDQSAV